MGFPHHASLLRDIVIYSLDVKHDSNALFFANLLRSVDPTDQGAFYLALCYYHQGRYRAAMDTLEGHDASNCLKLRGDVARRLKLYAEANDCYQRLEKAVAKDDECLFKRQLVTDEAGTLYNQGHNYVKMGRTDEAKDCLTRCLSVNPFMWSAFELLCNMGQGPAPSSVFKSEVAESIYRRRMQTSTLDGAEKSVQPTQLKQPAVVKLPPPPAAVLTSKGRGSRLPIAKPPLPLKKARVVENQVTNRPKTRNIPRFQAPIVLVGKKRVHDAQNEVPVSKRVARTQPEAPPSEPSSNTPSHSESVIHHVMDILVKMGDAYLALSNFRCKEAIAAFTSLPEPYRQSPWVLANLGRAYYEQQSYKMAIDSFKQVLAIDQHHHEHQVYHSVALWVLQSLNDAIFLGTRLLHADPYSPEAYCAMANAFDLKKDYDQAIWFLKRAIEIDSDFVYAHSLLGHEYERKKDTKAALQCFQRALTLDPRHYSAMYGLGIIYHYQSNFNMAALHLQRASELNPNNADMIGHLALVFQKKGELTTAVNHYDQAIAVNKKHLHSLYHLGVIYYQKGRYSDSKYLANLASQIAPDEHLVFLLLAHLATVENKRHDAIKHYSRVVVLDKQNAHSYMAEMEHALEKMRQGNGRAAFEKWYMDTVASDRTHTSRNLIYQDSV
jgi:anaphase-promoting complex subunit 3